MRLIANTQLYNIKIITMNMTDKILKIFSNTPLFIFIVSVFALLAAYISEYIFGLKPCVLCYYQRYAYWAAIGICILCFLIQTKINKLYLLLNILALIALATEVGIAFFHMGVEYKWFEMLSGCKGSMGYLDTITTPDKASSEIVIPCDKPAFVYILSMAGWNVVYSLGALIVALIFFIRKLKNG